MDGAVHASGFRQALGGQGDGIADKAANLILGEGDLSAVAQGVGTLLRHVAQFTAGGLAGVNDALLLRDQVLHTLDLGVEVGHPLHRGIIVRGVPGLHGPVGVLQRGGALVTQVDQSFSRVHSTSPLK